jgi:hypothetical protein
MERLHLRDNAGCQNENAKNNFSVSSEKMNKQILFRSMFLFFAVVFPETFISDTLQSFRVNSTLFVFTLIVFGARFSSGVANGTKNSQNAAAKINT